MYVEPDDFDFKLIKFWFEVMFRVQNHTAYIFLIIRITKASNYNMIIFIVRTTFLYLLNYFNMVIDSANYVAAMNEDSLEARNTSKKRK